VIRPLVVIGDVMLDVDRSGTVERLSPEAPVPVLRDPTDSRRPGGAALAALLAARSRVLTGVLPVHPTPITVS
jgi:D-beta-D-heptose 7-phosphate kinase/D-beta-D-heptose 1-phosphate adenosyltransferase